MSDAMREFMKKEIQEEREDAARIAAREADEQRAVKDIRSIMETLKMSANQAMDALQIPVSEQSRYTTLLQRFF